MENATKALLIAAAILIAIVLISLGVFVLRQGQDIAGNVNMNEAEVLAFNARINTYEGTIRGSQVVALLDRIDMLNNDLTLKNAEPVKVTYGSINTVSAIKSEIKTNYYYSVDMSTKDNMGLITEVIITDMTSTNP